MNAKETQLLPIIEGTKQYVVPLFQRPYTWERKDWDTLWNDLAEIADEEESRHHFIGSIVTMPIGSGPEGVTKFLLIDGQQRLTTLYILLAVLRDRARGFDGTLADEIDEAYLRNKFKSGDESYKLLPTQGDRQDFFAIVTGTGEKYGSKVRDVYKHYEKKLRADDLATLATLKRTIVERLMLVSIKLDSNDNPYLIFESLNGKGQPLTQADLIRNYFLMRIPIDQQEELYYNYWEPMQDRLDSSLTEFIRHFLMKEGQIVRQGDVYLSMKERADRKRSEDEMIDYLKIIAVYAGYYEKLLHPEKEPNPKLRDKMFRLNRLEVTTVYPFLLNVYRDYKELRISDDDVAEILDTLENFLIRRFVCGVPTNQLNKIFSPLYLQISTEASMPEAVKTVLKTRNYPKDADFRERLITSKLYGSGGRIQRTKIILERLETSFGHKETVPFDSLTIEHVMPQTLSQSWEKYLGANWEIVHETLLDSLGNLTLTGYNSPLSNMSFEQKRKILSDSHLELNGYFAHVAIWDEKAIRTRAEKLADRALSVWPYFGMSSDDLDEPKDRVTGSTPRAVNLLGRRIKVATWRDVAQQTLETIGDLDGEVMSEIAKAFPRFIGTDEAAFRTSRELKNGYFMEVNLSASAINRFCVQATEMAGLSSDDWQVDLEK